MLKAMLILLSLCSVGLAQSSADGSFSVHHLKNASYSLPPAQMQEAERIYHNVCTIVKHDFRSSIELHPYFTVVIGAERNEVHSSHARKVAEIWMKKWDPIIFAQAVVVVSFEEILTPEMIAQLGNRGVRQSNATVDVSDLAKP